MADRHPFPAEPTDSREAIMKATYEALCDHGYADLSIQRIADEFDKSKSLLYHHYDGKDDLLLDFLEYMLDEFEASTDVGRGEDPAAHLRTILDRVLAAELPDERAEFTRAMVELRARAATDDDYRDHFTRHDRTLRDRLAAVVERGVETGVFRDVDADRVAALLLVSVEGAMTERATADADVVADVRAELDAYVDDRLLADGEDRQ